MEVRDGWTPQATWTSPLLPPLALELGSRQLVGGAVEPTLVPPLHPLGSGQLDLLEARLGASPAAELGLMDTDQCLGQGVVVALTGQSKIGSTCGPGQCLLTG